jgi:hypothetical protein
VGEIHAPDRLNHATNRNSFLHGGMAMQSRLESMNLVLSHIMRYGSPVTRARR